MATLPTGIRDVLDRQRLALERMRPTYKRELMAIALEVQRELEERLVALAGSPERYTTQETRVVLAQVRAITDTLGAEFGVKVGDVLESLGGEAAAVGRQTLLSEIDVWASEFRGSVRRIAPAELTDALLSPGLLEYYQVSRDTYGMDAIATMRRELAKAMQSGEALSDTTLRLSGAVDIPEWRAERIVRTEQSFAMHTREMADMESVYGPGAPGWKKQLVATLDNRTGEDSKYVNGQERPFDEPFEDNEGRVYMAPPNRPNDREILVMVPDFADV